MIKAVAFDFGHTLASSGNPLNWQELYDDALTDVLSAIGIKDDLNRINDGKAVLLKYNTRVNNREYEVDSDTIFGELFNKWNICDFTKLDAAKEAFYSFFMGDAVIYDDVQKVLSALKDKGYKTGILTDLAYGMDNKYALQDIAEILAYFDVVLTSTEIGFRKPSPRGYLLLAEELDVHPIDCVYIGDEEKDIIGANNAGMISVHIDRNGTNNDYGQNYTISSLEQILSLI
ncbi:HAD family hydrolase [Chloroflexota bacterium]